jgi:serine/threonine protein kinase
MTTDRRKVLRLYHLALAREADDRRAFLSQACAGDDELRRDVESLLAHDPPEGFLESQAIDSEAAQPFADTADVLIGTHIGVYRVDFRLGSGGMGEVYRATDTALGREVAIKVLPPAFAFDPGRRVRLEREAKALVPPPLVTPRVSLPGFWVDRYEITNRQFKAFVDAGGYQKEEYWKEPFVKDGRRSHGGRASADFATPRTDLARPAGNWARIPRAPATCPWVV